MRSIFFVLMMLLLPTVHANDALGSLGIPCKSIPVQKETVILSSKKPVLIIIHNISSSDLWLAHASTDKGASAGWNSELKPDKWSALALGPTDGPFEMSCIESRPGHEQQLPCAGLVAVCAWSKTQAKTKVGDKAAISREDAGTYWKSENSDLAGLLQTLSLSTSFTRTIDVSSN